MEKKVVRNKGREKNKKMKKEKKEEEKERWIDLERLRKRDIERKKEM